MKDLEIHHYSILFSFFDSKKLKRIKDTWQYSSIIPFHEMSERLKQVILRSIENEIKGQKKISDVSIISYHLENIEFLS